MNLTEFHAQVRRQGLARNTNWVCTVFPPSQIGSATQAVDTILNQQDNRANINLPSQELTQIPRSTREELNIGDNLSTNLSVPTLGFTVRSVDGVLRALNMFCESCQLPARDIMGVEWSEYGETRTLGVKHTHGDLMVGYYCSEDLRERLFFELWQDLIFNHLNKKHGYYNDYIGTVEITKYNANWETMARYKFNEVYPTNVGENALSYDGTDVLKLQIAFKYRNYERIL